MEPNEHAELAKREVGMALDCLRRAIDGINSASWGYACDQLCKATVRIQDARWRCDTAWLTGTSERPVVNVTSLQEEKKA